MKDHYHLHPVATPRPQRTRNYRPTNQFWHTSHRSSGRQDSAYGPPRSFSTPPPRHTTPVPLIQVDGEPVTQHDALLDQFAHQLAPPPSTSEQARPGKSPQIHKITQEANIKIIRNSSQAFKDRFSTMEPSFMHTQWKTCHRRQAPLSKEINQRYIFPKSIRKHAAATQ
jgi:hypothetical protein